MKIHRFYIPHIEILAQNIIVSHETNLIHQLKNVFRYKPGQIVHIFNQTVGEIEVEIITLNKKDMSFRLNKHTEQAQNCKGQYREVVLYMSIIKNSNFDLVIEKAAELGVSKIVPVISGRTIKNKLNYDRLNKIIIEAIEQSGRIKLMRLEDTYDLKSAIELAQNDSDTIYFGSLDVDNNDKFNKDNSNKKISIFIGPEGGYSNEEIALFREKKTTPLRLGDYVLRAETAAIVACGLLSL